MIILKGAESIKDFADIIKPVAKASKSIDKKDELAKELYQLIYPQKIESESPFKISAIFADQEKSVEFAEEIAFIRTFIIDYLSKSQTIQYRTSEAELEEALRII